MNIDCSFSLRFKTDIAGQEFISESDCDDRSAATTLCRAMFSEPTEIELIAAQFCFNLAKPEGAGCHLLDNESDELLAELCHHLVLGTEHFWNNSMGSYDPLMNKVIPLDMGTVYPDGTLRMAWREAEARFDFDTSFETAKTLLEVLLEMQDVPYFKATDAEYEDADYLGLKMRRKAALFELGLWPADDDTYEPRPKHELTTELAKYAAMVPAAGPVAT